LTKLAKFAALAAIFSLAPAMSAAQKDKSSQDKPSAGSQGGAFAILRGEVDGHPVFAMIDMGLRNSPDIQQLPFFLSLSTPLISPTGDGLPTRTDAESLNTWEDAVDTSLRPIGKFVFVGRVTWNGNRELLYYVKDQQLAVEALKKLSEAHSTRPFAFRCNRDEKWDKANFWFNYK
jgi:Family of unknown function (DUF695)